MVFAATYMLLGMALLSMCFTLIQEEIAVKFKLVAEKIAARKQKAEEKRRRMELQKAGAENEDGEVTYDIQDSPPTIRNRRGNLKDD